MTVTLFRKRGNSFVPVASNRVVLNRSGAYLASFRRPRPGIYRATAKFAGSENRRASRASATFRC
jgi:hypothetical protein